jgi:hypothetical protein
MKRKLFAFLLVCLIMLCGCHNKSEKLNKEDNVTQFADSYDWVAGESPVVDQRMGLKRAGVNNADYAISPNGVYYIYKSMAQTEAISYSYVLYSDHDSDTVIKLCGRADCDHSNPDCNACISEGNNIYYYEGYLYAVSGMGGSMEGFAGAGCKLIRMDIDGSNHMMVFDLDQFVQDLGYDFARCDMMDSGECLFSAYEWVEVEAGPDEEAYTSSCVKSYRYALDGSMDEPQPIKSKGWPMYHCGDVFLTLMNGTRNGGYNGYDFSLGHWDMMTDGIIYLTDHPGVPGFYGKEAGYYFRDGAVIRLNYETRQEERIIETGLDGDYYVMCFPDCLVVADQSFNATDNQIYIYNWAYDLVDTIRLPSFSGIPYDQSLIVETEERLIFSDDLFTWVPKYYIEKSELGIGKAKVYSFKLPDLAAEFEYWED